MTNKKFLVTGGLGYIGSHTVLALIATGAEILILDNLSNSKLCVLERLKSISGKSIKFIQGDVRDRALLRSIFSSHQIDGVLHFAGLKAVGESVEFPAKYYDNNVVGSLILLEEMIGGSVKIFVFSSSATVYGEPDTVPIDETFELRPKTPYGQSKLMVEIILRDMYKAHPDLSIAILRYFNPAGAHSSGLIGEDPLGTPNNLIPFISQTISGKRKILSVFGNDYPTHDGTGVRDYIHVEDLAAGHLAALKLITSAPTCITVNLATGTPHSVMDVIRVFEEITGATIPYVVVDRRSGDVPTSYADPTLAMNLLDWCATRNIQMMCKDALRWDESNHSLQSD
jgi:UDP-glucose 4-epimerase